MNPAHRSRLLRPLLLGCLAAMLLTTQLTAQVQIDYSNGQTDAATYDTSSTLTLSILAGTATQSGVLSGSGRVLKVGAGTLILSGVNTYTNDTVVNFGTLQVAAGASMSQAPANIFIGDETGDAGTLLISGGTVGSDSGYIGTHAGSTGTVTVTGGTWTNSDTLYLGNDGTGVLNLSGGSVTAQLVNQGYTAGSSGTLNVSGGTLTNNTSYFLGYSGSAVLNLSGGTVSNAATSVGFEAGGSGTANVSGGTWNNSGGIVFGESGSGTLNLSGGVIFAQVIYEGLNAGSSGTMNVSHGALINNTSYFLGYSGTGVLNLSGGSISNAASSVGLNASGSGTANISGGTWTNDGSLVIGESGTGVLNLSGGSVSNTSSTVGLNESSRGTVNVSGGTWTSTRLDIGSYGTGTVNLTSTGTISVGPAGDGTVTLGVNSQGSGTLSIGTGGQAGTLLAALITNGDGTASVVFNHSGNLNFTPAIIGSNMSVVFSGTGTTTLSTRNNYLGDTRLMGGTLVLDLRSVHDDVISSSALVLGGGTLRVTGPGSQGFASFSTSGGAGSIVVDADEQIYLHTLGLVQEGSAVNFNTAAGGAEAGITGNTSIMLDGQTAGQVINSAFTVTDSTGFGLATVNGGGQIVRMAAQPLLPPNGAGFADYLINNNSDRPEGNAALLFASSASVHSVTVDTTAAAGVLTLDQDVTLSSDVWNFGSGGSGGHSYKITGGAGLSSSTPGGILQFDNYNSAPVTLDTALVDHDGMAVLFQGPGTTVLTQHSVLSGITTLVSGTLMLADGGYLDSTSNVNLGTVPGNMATLVIHGGTLRDQYGYIAYGTGSSATATLASGQWVNSLDLYVGLGGAAVLNLSGSGSVSNKDTVFGYFDSSSGVANMSGGTWSTSGQFMIGYFGSGVLNLSGGTVTGGATTLGYYAGGSGTLNMSGGVWQTGGDFRVGNDGAGVVNLSGGSLSSSGFGYLGVSAGSSGTVNIRGGQMTMTYDLTAGVYGGTGVVNLTDGGVLNLGARRDRTLYLAYDDGSQGTLNIGTGGVSGTLNAALIAGGGGVSTVNFNHTDNITFGAAMTGPLAVNQFGPGTTTLTAASTYSGPTAPLGGTLELAFGGVSANILPSSTDVAMGSATLLLSGTGTQSISSLAVRGSSAAEVWMGRNETLTLGSLRGMGPASALNLNTAAGGADGASIGTSVIVMNGQPPGAEINPALTVTDSTGFGLAAVNADNQIYRITAMNMYLLPISDSDSNTNYLIDNNNGDAFAEGSASMHVMMSETARSITVDTTRTVAMLVLDQDVTLSTDVWNFGGAIGHLYAIGGGTLSGATPGGILQINNYNSGNVIIASPFMDNGGTTLLFQGTGSTTLSGTSVGLLNIMVTSGSLFIGNGGNVSYTGTVTIGSQQGDNATLALSPGILQGSYGVIGDAAGARGTVTLDGNGRWTQPNGDLILGKSGIGVLNLSRGGASLTQNGYLGLYAGSSGTANVGDGGEWSMNRGLHIGGEGAGVVNLTGGTLTVGGESGTGTITLGTQGVLNVGLGAGTGTLQAGTITGTYGGVVNFNFNALQVPELVLYTTALAGNVAVNKTGGGQLTLVLQNSYTGATTVNAGTLYLNFFPGRISADLLSSSSSLVMGGGTLSLVAQRGGSSQTLNGLTTSAATGSKIWLGSKMTLNLGALTAAGAGSALNIDTSAGNADGATVGTSIVTLSGQTQGAVINPGFTVTDATGFGLATVNEAGQIIRITDTLLLPATGADAGTDYRIDNHDGSSIDAGSSTLEVSASQTARSITVDTTGSSGTLTLGSGVSLSTDVWNFGGNFGSGYGITTDSPTSGLSAATAGGMLQINNYNFSQVTIAAPILDNGGSSLRVAGTGATLLNGTNSYQGETIVNSGTLFINGDSSAATGQITVQSAATLSGSGTVGGDIHVLNGGTLTPGDHLGLGTLNGTTATLDASSIFHVQGGGTLMTGLHLNGAFTLTSGALLEITTDGDLTKNSYVLISAASGLDGHTTFTLPSGFALPDGYHLTYTGTKLELDSDHPTLAPDTAFWTGAQGSNWSTLNSGATNWATAADGLTDTGALPDTPTDVTFSATGVGTTQTNLDASFTLNSLTINSDTSITSETQQSLTVTTTTTVNALLVLGDNVKFVGEGDLTISSEGALAGSGAQMERDQSIFVNGAIKVGDQVTSAAQVLSLNTSGTGATVMGAGSSLFVNLYSGAGLGDNTALSAAGDRVNLYGTLDATAGGTLVIGNPTHLTGFAGGDQWKVISLNNGRGSITGHLALNDSAVGLPTGFIGSFDETTGIYSIADHRPEMTANSSGLPMANAESQSIISGTQTATNDVNNHLFNLRSGGGEEEDGGDGSISAALDYGVVMGEGDGPEEPIARRVKRSRQWEVFTTVNYGNVRLNPISSQSGVQIDSWASSVGVERHLSRGMTLGFAATFLQSHQAYTGGLGHLDLEGPTLSAYLAYVKKSFWSSLLYSFGDYDLGSTRNPGLGLPVASGATTAYVNSVQFNTGWNFRFQNRTLVTGPFVGIDYLHGSVDAYNETGGGAGALHYNRQTFESLVTRVGWSLSKKIDTTWAAITPQIRLSYERQNIKNNGTSVNLINAPFSASGGNQTPGQDYMVLGGGVNFQFSPSFNLMLGYQLQLFRNNMTAQFGSIRFGYKF